MAAPILYAMFTASFIAGLVRLVLAVVGAYFVYYSGQEYLIDQVRMMITGGMSGFAIDSEAIFYLAGFYDAFNVLLAAMTFRMALTFGRKLSVWF